MTMRKRRHLLILIAIVPAMALLAVAFRPAPVEVGTATVVRGTFVESIEEEARTLLRNPWEIAAPISGYLRRIELEVGDRVAAGDRLAQLEPLPSPALDSRAREQARDAVAAAEARLESARATLETREAERAFAESEYRRNADLFQRGSVSGAALDRMRTQQDAARSAVRAARGHVETARHELLAARVLVDVADGEHASPDRPTVDLQAPVAGVILRRHRVSAGPVSAGQALLELGALDRLEVRADLLSTDAVRVAPGMRVVIDHWGGDAPLEGTVSRVQPSGFTRISALGVEEQRVPVWVELQSPRAQRQRLGDGYRVETRFILWEGDDVLQIPTSALFRQDDGWRVFAVEDGRARMRTVSTGRRSGLHTQILEGLREGAMVITHPGDRLSEGTRVAVANAS